MDFENLSKSKITFADKHAPIMIDQIQAVQAGSLQRIANALEALGNTETITNAMKFAGVTDRLDKMEDSSKKILQHMPTINRQVGKLEDDYTKMENLLDGMGSMIDRAIGDDEEIVSKINSRLDALEAILDNERKTDAYGMMRLISRRDMDNSGKRALGQDRGKRADGSTTRAIVAVAYALLIDEVDVVVALHHKSSSSTAWAQMLEFFMAPIAKMKRMGSTLSIVSLRTKQTIIVEVVAVTPGQVPVDQIGMKRCINDELPVDEEPPNQSD